MPNLKDRFRQHVINIDQQAGCDDVRAKAYALAFEIETAAPASREQSLALTKLEESVFWANAAIARNEKEPEA